MITIQEALERYHWNPLHLEPWDSLDRLTEENVVHDMLADDLPFESVWMALSDRYQFGFVDDPLDDEEATDESLWIWPDGPWGWNADGTSKAPTATTRKRHVNWYHDYVEMFDPQ